MDKQINETLVSGTIKVRETRVFCFCDVNSRSDPYGKKTVDTAFSVSAPTAAVAEEKMLLFENASGQKPQTLYPMNCFQIRFLKLRL